MSDPPANPVLRFTAGISPWLHRAGLPLAVFGLGLAGGFLGPVPAAALAGLAALGAYASARFLLDRLDHVAQRFDVSDYLIQSQKMAALGEISSGIAHEINTPLAVISQIHEWLEHLLAQPDLNEPGLRKELASSIAQIAAQVGRCRDITHNMLNFARTSEAIIQETSLSSLLEDMIKLVEREHRSNNITFERSYDRDLAPAPTDPQLLRQVALNLLNNAAQAVGRDGAVTVATGQDHEGPFFSVSDSGPGIPREYRDRIFNPFFTTKPPGKGTGLGLSICLAIVTRLGGTIRVDSAPGRGATFTVRLPVTAQPQAEAA